MVCRIKLKGGKIASMDEHWADDGDCLLYTSAAVPHEQQTEQVLFPAGKVDIGHAGGLIGGILDVYKRQVRQ